MKQAMKTMQIKLKQKYKRCNSLAFLDSEFGLIYNWISMKYTYIHYILHRINYIKLNSQIQYANENTSQSVFSFTPHYKKSYQYLYLVMRTTVPILRNTSVNKKPYVLIFRTTKAHEGECHTTATHIKLEVIQLPGKKSNQKICQRMRSALCYLHTNLTFDSNTSPGRNFPTCRQIIEMKANEMKQRIKPDVWE